MLSRLLEECHTREELQLVLSSFDDLQDMLMISSGPASASDGDDAKAGTPVVGMSRALEVNADSVCDSLLEACERCGCEEWSTGLLQEMHALRADQSEAYAADGSGCMANDGPAASSTGSKAGGVEWGLEQAEQLFLDWLCWVQQQGRREGGAVGRGAAAGARPPWRTKHDTQAI